MKTSISILLAVVIFFTCALSGCPGPDPVLLGPPILEVESPFDIGESPKGISLQKTLVLKNVGESKMTITDFELEPDDGIFLVGISNLPFDIKPGNEKDITVTFRPTQEKTYTTELSLDYNHEQVFTPDPLELTGLGISNLVCLACEPPPEPECRLEGEVLVYFESTRSTDCESEDGVCSYLMLEELCEHGLCDEDTKQCPLPEGWDAGMVDLDFDDDGIPDDEDEYPDHNNNDLQFIIDLIEQSGLTVAPLELGQQYWDNGRLIHALFSGNYHLDDVQLLGALPPSVKNPSLMTKLDLSMNEMSGELPSELFELENLTDLDLTANLFSGEISAAIGNLTTLEGIHLTNNQFTGSIPDSIGNLENLRDFRIQVNNLSGHIPATLGNLENLALFWAFENNLDGPIPPELGNLQNLLKILLQSNALSGTIPKELGNISTLTQVQLSRNNLTGVIPPELGSLQSLESLDLSDNQLTGSIPPQLGSLQSLESLDLSDNQLTGPLPTELGDLENLNFLYLANNQLSGSIPAELESIQTLRFLNLTINQLTGSIPTELGSLQNLESLRLGNNLLIGTIPSELGNLQNLESLSLDNNLLIGTIPSELENLENLTSLYLMENQLSGAIPPELGNLENLTYISLDKNQLTGAIPTELGNLQNVNYLGLYDNQLSGTIPEALCNLPDSTNINVSTNKLCPPYPSCVADDIDTQDTSQCTCEPGYEIFDMECVVITCAENQFVASNACMACVPGTVNIAGDDASGDNTACDPILCNTDQYVLNNVCTPCSGSDTNAAGDDASGENTACDSDLCIGIECGENASCNSANTFNNFCECLPGYQDNNEDGDCVLACDDTDFDDICNDVDNCPDVSNSDQANYDEDSLGDACDPKSFYHEDDIAFIEEFASNCGLNDWSEFYNVSWTQFTSGFEDRPKGRIMDLIHYGNSNGPLTCEIPASIINAVELWRIVLPNNNLYGSIPVGIGNLEQLISLQLQNNNLSGAVPDDLCDTSASVYLTSNQLCPVYPSCLTSNQIDPQDTTDCN